MTRSTAPDPRYDLGRMSIRQLVRVYLSYPAVLAYVGLATLSLVGAVQLGALGLPFRAGVAIIATVLAYPVVWYLLHRFVLHGRWLYRSRYTAALWKRVHFDHHQSPQRMDVLFGSLVNTVPTIATASLPIGWLIGGPAIALVAFGAGLLATCVYEFCHCVQHLNFTPSQPWLQRIKRLHMAHHFHNENGNYGIISFWPDQLLGTHYDGPRARPRSATVHNLGYDDAEARRYPWVAELTGDAPSPRR